MKKRFLSPYNLLASVLSGLFVVSAAFPAWFFWYIKRLMMEHDISSLADVQGPESSELFDKIESLIQLEPRVARTLINYVLPILLCLLLVVLLLRKPAFAFFTSNLFVLFFSLAFLAYLPSRIPYSHHQTLKLANMVRPYVNYGNPKGYPVLLLMLLAGMVVCVIMNKWNNRPGKNKGE